MEMCIRCNEREPESKNLCHRCYYANKRGSKTYKEILLKRNYIQNKEGIFSDKYGKKWFVDLDDFKKFRYMRWSNNGLGYARNGKNYLHKLICPNFKYVDHIDRNVFNNHKINLREGIWAFNKTRKLGISGLHNVVKVRNKWEVRFMRNGKKIHLGYFKDKSIAYKKVIEFLNQEDIYIIG